MSCAGFDISGGSQAACAIDGAGGVFVFESHSADGDREVLHGGAACGGGRCAGNGFAGGRGSRIFARDEGE